MEGAEETQRQMVRILHLENLLPESHKVGEAIPRVPVHRDGSNSSSPLLILQIVSIMESNMKISDVLNVLLVQNEDERQQSDDRMKFTNVMTRFS